MSSSISRRSHEIHGNITTSTELEGAISKHTKIPGDDKIHKPYQNIEILPCGLKVRFGYVLFQVQFSSGSWNL